MESAWSGEVSALAGLPEAASDAPLDAERIVATYLARIHRFAVMLSPLGVDPDDLAQDACLRVIERAAQFDSRRGSLDAWVWRIVVNLARDQGRLARRVHLLTDRVVSFQRAGSAPASPESLALDRLRDDVLLAAVRRLPRRHRGLVALRYGAGLSAAEIAGQLGTTRMATAKALRRALDRLRRDLSPLEEQS
jgi:RNA polymerase sigma-70 factor (ECF subfamily)